MSRECYNSPWCEPNERCRCKEYDSWKEETDYQTDKQRPMKPLDDWTGEDFAALMFMSLPFIYIILVIIDKIAN